MKRFVFERRLSTTQEGYLRVTVLSILFSIFLFGVFLLLGGSNPILAYLKILRSAFGSLRGISHTTLRMIPLVFTALAFALPYRAGVWNIGAEGQMYMGAFLATGVALFIRGMPDALIVPAIIFSGFLAGAIWGAISGILRGLLKVDEIVTTLMMNYIAILWVSYLVTGPWREKGGWGYSHSSLIPKERWIPFITGTEIPVTIVLGVLFAFIIALLLKRSRLGYEIRVVGANPKTAELAGMSSLKTILLVMLVAGGLAGIAGAGEIAGVQHRLRMGFSPGYGFTGIVIAFLSRGNPLVIIPVSFLFAGMIVGGNTLQIVMKLPSGIVEIFQGMTLFCLAGGQFFLEYGMKRRKRWEIFSSSL